MRPRSLDYLTVAVLFIVILGGVIFMAGSLAPCDRPDIMTENMRGVLMLLGLGLLVLPAVGLARTWR